MAKEIQAAANVVKSVAAPVAAAPGAMKLPSPPVAPANAAAEAKPISKDDVSKFTFKEYRKVGTTRLSDESLAVGTKVQTLEGEYTCAEPSRLAIDAAGNVYPVAESIFRKSYDLVVSAGPIPTTPAVPKTWVKVKTIGAAELRERAMRVRTGVATALEKDLKFVAADWSTGGGAADPNHEPVVVMSVDMRAGKQEKILEALRNAGEKESLRPRGDMRQVDNRHHLLTFDVYE